MKVYQSKVIIIIVRKTSIIMATSNSNSKSDALATSLGVRFDPDDEVEPEGDEQTLDSDYSSAFKTVLKS